MLNKKLIIGFIIALIALIVVGFVALNFVPNNEILDLNLTDNATENITDNLTENLTVNITDDAVNGSEVAANETAVVDANNTNASSDIDEGDVLKKQTFTVTANETGQYKGMEPGTYVLYYTENDGPIKIDKVG
jgi:hypothetical protein